MDVHDPVLVLDANARFGPPRPAPESAPHDNLWIIDHPVGGVYRLADGKWHSLICFRVTDSAMSTFGALPEQSCGCWVGEVHGDTDDQPRPEWNFR